MSERSFSAPECPTPSLLSIRMRSSDLWSNRDQEGNQIEMLLPPKEFPDFANDPVTWDTFLAKYLEKELVKYTMAVSIVHAYEEKTPQALDSFEEHVMAKTYSEEEADIILTTCHSAKGLEWDRVEICPDLLDLNTASFTDTVSQMVHHPSFMRAVPGDLESELGQSAGEKRKGWEFGLSNFANDINLLYVGITRAKKKLSMPQSIKALLEQMDVMHFLVNSFVQEHLRGKNPSSDDESMLTLSKPRGRKLKKGEVWGLYHDICLPLRTELGVPPTRSIVPHLFPGCSDDDDERGAKVKAETVKSEMLEDIKPPALKPEPEVASENKSESKGESKNADNDSKSVSMLFDV